MALLRRHRAEPFDQRVRQLVRRLFARQLQLRAPEQFQQQVGPQALVAQLREQARRAAEFQQYLFAPRAHVARQAHALRQHVAGELDVGGVFLARVGAQLADALVDGGQHRGHVAPSFLEFAGDAAPAHLAVFVRRLRFAQPGRKTLHHLDRLPRGDGQQVEAQVVGDVALEVVHDLARLRILAEQLAGRLRQVVQRFLDLARAQRVAHVAVALAVALHLRQVALRQARLDLLQQRQHEFETALLAVVQQHVQAPAHVQAQLRQQFARVALDAVLARLGRGAGFADRVALQVRQQLDDLFAPQLEVVRRHDAVHRQLHLGFDTLQQRALVLVQQEHVRQRVFRERRDVDGALAEIGEFRERVLGHAHLLAHEGVALLVGRAPRRGAVGGDEAEERLHHQRRQLVGADVVAQALLRVQHGLAERGIGLRVRQAHVAEALFRHARVVRPELVLLLVDGDGTLAVGEIGRGEVLEQRVGHHLVHVLHVLRGLVGEVRRVDEVHVVERRAAADDAVRVRPLHARVHVAHARLQFHHRRVRVRFGALLVRLGVAGRQEHHEVDLAVRHFLARDGLGDPAQVDGAAGAGAARVRRDDDDAELGRVDLQPETLVILLALDAGVTAQKIQRALDASAQLGVFVEQIQPRQRADLARALGRVDAERAQLLRPQRHPALDQREARQAVVGFVVLRQVERLDEAFLVRQLDQFVPRIGALRLAFVDDGVGVQVEVQEARDGKVGDGFDARRVIAIPYGRQDAAADAHHDFHAGAAGADEQRRTQVDLELGFAGKRCGIGKICHGVLFRLFDFSMRGVSGGRRRRPRPA